MTRLIAGAALLVVFCTLLFTVPWKLAGALVMALGGGCAFGGWAIASGAVPGDATRAEQFLGAVLVLIGGAALYFGGRTLAANGLEWMI